ncbi:LigB domain-containing protein [Hyphomicrobiales bacterium]|nr:LigB domain-containing protein [Hyphomicrobiales bacterium]CAH1691403.1 LigB domain-containing protein [Hyphomicrobiales bacterium]
MNKVNGVIAGAAVPHAPQFHSLPATEDADQVERVRTAMQEAGEGLRALNPDVVIVMTNDHGDEFIVGPTPAFTVHCGNVAQGMHKHKGPWSLRGDIGYDVVRGLMQEGFDPAFTLDSMVPTAFTIPYEFMGYERDAPFLPLYINSYVPPQPSAERCYAFGKAIDRVFARLGLRAVFIASGGLSHYPGTPQYPNPDVTTDKIIYGEMAKGNLRHLLSYSDEALDASGNVEARAWIALAGALGERKPDITAWEPSWHHTYAVFGWSQEARDTAIAPHYPPIPPEHVGLARALFELRKSEAACRQYLADGAGFASNYGLTSAETDALTAFDTDRLRDGFNIHALLVAGAERRLEQLKSATHT